VEISSAPAARAARGKSSSRQEARVEGAPAIFAAESRICALFKGNKVLCWGNSDTRIPRVLALAPGGAPLIVQ